MLSHRVLFWTRFHISVNFTFLFLWTFILRTLVPLHRIICFPVFWPPISVICLKKKQKGFKVKLNSMPSFIRYKHKVIFYIKTWQLCRVLHNKAIIQILNTLYINKSNVTKIVIEIKLSGKKIEIWVNLPAEPLSLGSSVDVWWWGGWWWGGAGGFWWKLCWWWWWCWFCHRGGIWFGGLVLLM